MKRYCPITHCHSSHIIKYGTFKRKNDSRVIQRFRCKCCGKQFSASTGTLEYYQKKRRINFQIFKHFISKTSQREIARLMKINKNTVARKFDYWSKKARLENQKFNKKLQVSKATNIQFDDLITKEITKLKPLSVTVVVDSERSYILGAKVSQIAAFGRLAQPSVKKYGRRSSNHREKLGELFYEIHPLIINNPIIKSDLHKNYLSEVKKVFPKSKYDQFKADRSCIAGQGELKRSRFDPLFAINHALARLRDSLNRLLRRNWAVTQDPARLQGHLEMYIHYWNFFRCDRPIPVLTSG